MTDAERAIWFALRDRRLDGFKFRRQAGIRGYIVDFLCAQARLVVEIDGGQHTPEVDAHRTAAIEAAGFRVVRCWNNDVLANLPGVLATLLEHLQHTPSLSSPSPPSGRGPG